MVRGRHSCLWNWRRTFWKGTICAGRHINTLEQRMLPSRWHLFQGRSSIFKKHNAKQHTASIKTAWLHSRRVWVLSWPACSPSLSPTENLESHEGNKKKYNKDNPGLSRWNLYHTRMGQNSSLSNRLIIKEEVTPLIWDQSCKSLYSGFVFIFYLVCHIFWNEGHKCYDLGFMTLTDAKIWSFWNSAFFLKLQLVIRYLEMAFCSICLLFSAFPA